MLIVVVVVDVVVDVVVVVVVDVVAAVVNVVSVVHLCWRFGVGVFGGAAAVGDEEREREDRKARTAKREKGTKKKGRSLYTP